MRLKQILNEQKSIELYVTAINELEPSINESVLMELSLTGLKDKFKHLVKNNFDDDVSDKLIGSLEDNKLDKNQIKDLMKKAKKGEITVKEIENLEKQGKIDKNTSGPAKHKAKKREDGKRGKQEKEKREKIKKELPEVKETIKTKLEKAYKDDLDIDATVDLDHSGGCYFEGKAKIKNENGNIESRDIKVDIKDGDVKVTDHIEAWDSKSIGSDKKITEISKDLEELN